MLRTKIIQAVLLLNNSFFSNIYGGVVSNFDIDTDGWIVFAGSGQLTHVSSGGNPSGFLRYEDAIIGETNMLRAVAPSQFLGDLSNFVGGTLSFDLKASPTDMPLEFIGIVTITGNGVTISNDFVSFNSVTSEWQTYSGGFDAVSWGVSEQLFALILADVTEITLNLEANNNAGELVDLDNFSLRAASNEVVPVFGLQWILVLIGSLLGLGYRKIR